MLINRKSKQCYFLIIANYIYRSKSKFTNLILYLLSQVSMYKYRVFFVIFNVILTKNKQIFRLT